MHAGWQPSQQQHRDRTCGWCVSGGATSNVPALFWMHHMLPLVASIMHSASDASTTAWRATTMHALRVGGAGGAPGPALMLAMHPSET